VDRVVRGGSISAPAQTAITTGPRTKQDEIYLVGDNREINIYRRTMLKVLSMSFGGDYE